MPDPRDRELVEAVRAELAAIDPPRACCRRAERLGLGDAATGRARSAVVARLAVRLSEEARGGGGDDPTDDVDWSGLRQHCRSAWLRGRFLSVGSLSLGPGGSHLELVVRAEESHALAERLAEAGVPSSARQRRGRGVVTVKGHEAVLALLRWCGASSSVLEVEVRLVARQLHGHLNRVLNAESANLRRSVDSSVRQLEMIGRLEATGTLRDLSPLEQSVARERQAAPEASFTELAERLRVSRARVQRAFARLEAADSRDDPSDGASRGIPPGAGGGRRPAGRTV